MNIIPSKQSKRQGVIPDPNRPTCCPICKREAPPGRVFNRVNTIFRKRDGKTTQRYRCVWPDCRETFSVRPADHQDFASQENAVEAYSALKGTYRQLSEQTGYSPSSIWRWVNQACREVSSWLRGLTTVVMEWLPGTSVQLVVREEKRKAWHSRRIRRPGKIDQLLQLEQLPGWVQKCRQTVADLPPVPEGHLAFCRVVLPRLC
ncbi:MAG: hypothetical protein A4E52_01929 [Pelotomaculum sp. PtaB.Bin013]|nr:MAG: hypothetical protein A4E52_01929 [Pelotomaculum sp. PtaB.Bin013]